jgi:hypothetical protein
VLKRHLEVGQRPDVSKVFRLLIAEVVLDSLGKGATPVERSFRSDLLDALSVFEVVFKLRQLLVTARILRSCYPHRLIGGARLSPDAARERGRRHERGGRGLSSRSRE